MRAMEAAKQAAADERTAWRAAVTEKLKRQAADREDKLRAELLKQRDEQLEVSPAACICELAHMLLQHDDWSQQIDADVTVCFMLVLFHKFCTCFVSHASESHSSRPKIK